MPARRNHAIAQVNRVVPCDGCNFLFEFVRVHDFPLEFFILMTGNNDSDTLFKEEDRF